MGANTLTPASANINISSNMEPSPAPSDRSKRRRSRKPKENKPNDRKAKKEPSQDSRLLELSKLTKRHIPITINGLAVSKILELAPEGNASRRAKLEFLAKHIEKVLNRDPQQAIYLSFVITPSDPDFPFDLDVLKFNLTVPPGYPRDAKALPSLIVLNSEIPRGFAVNIERGFRQISALTKAKKPPVVEEGEVEVKLVDGKGLLSQIQTLDRYLEVFLKQEKRQTMKFVTFKGTPQMSPVPTPAPTPPPKARDNKEFKDVSNVSQEILEKRNQSIQEMNQKFGSSVKLFNKSASDSRYKVQIPLQQHKLPLPYLWSLSKTAEIFVTIPINYPESQLTVSVPPNFSTNLLVAKKVSIQNAGESMVEITQEAKTFEKNLRANVESWLAAKPLPLVDVLNWVANSLPVLGLEPTKYSEWNGMVEQLAKAQVV